MEATLIDGLSSNGSSVLGTKGGSFGDNPFLALLVAQMRTQTPLEPVDNASFMQQMSSYSSMQQQHDLNDNMLKLLDFQGLLARLQGLSQGSSLLGKEVTWLGEGNAEQKGIVQSVFVDEQGAVKLRIGDQEIDSRRVTGIAQADGAAAESQS